MTNKNVFPILTNLTVFLKPDKWKTAIFFLLVFFVVINYQDDLNTAKLMIFLPAFILGILISVLLAVFFKFFVTDKFIFSIMRTNDFFSIALAFSYCYFMACLIVFSFEKFRKKFETKKILALTTALFAILLLTSARINYWFVVFTEPSIANLKLFIEILALSAFWAYILTTIILFFVVLGANFLQLSFPKKAFIGGLLFLLFWAAFHPALIGNIIPETLNKEEREMALLAIADADSQLDIQGDGILQYEVVSVKTSAEHITPFQGGCGVEIKMQTRTIFGRPFYEIIVYFNSKEGLEFCDLEIPNECDFDQHCKP